MRELTAEEVLEIAGASPELSGFDGAGAIMAVVGFGSLFTPIGPITATIAVSSAGGLATAEVIARYC